MEKKNNKKIFSIQAAIVETKHLKKNKVKRKM